MLVCFLLTCFHVRSDLSRTIGFVFASNPHTFNATLNRDIRKVRRAVIIIRINVFIGSLARLSTSKRRKSLLFISFCGIIYESNSTFTGKQTRKQTNKCASEQQARKKWSRQATQQANILSGCLFHFLLVCRQTSKNASAHILRQGSRLANEQVKWGNQWSKHKQTNEGARKEAGKWDSKETCLVAFLLIFVLAYLLPCLLACLLLTCFGLRSDLSRTIGLILLQMLIFNATLCRGIRKQATNHAGK